MQLKRCEAKPKEAGITAEEWQLGTAVIQEIFRSPSTIKLMRSDFNRASVVLLLETFGVTGLITFLNQVHGNILQTQPDGAILVNESDNQELVINNLRIIASRQVAIKLDQDGKLSVSGLSLASTSNTHGSDQIVKKIDFSPVGAMNITTNLSTIINIPITFFSLSRLVSHQPVGASEAFRAISSVALDSGFNWRGKATLIFRNSNITRVFSKFSETTQGGGSFSTTLEQIVKNSQTFIFGGSADQLVSVSFASPLHCDMKFVNIPILGNKTIGLDFANGIGLSHLTSQPSGNLLARIYGIKTDLGSVSHVEINGTELRLKVGPITIPLTFARQGTAKGVRLEDISCK